MHAANRRLSRQNSHGYAMVTGLVMLAALSIIALVTSRTTIIETRVATGYSNHAVAQECSETLRASVARIFDAYVFYRDWPISIGGKIPDSQFGVKTVSGLRISNSVVGGAAEWRHYLRNIGPLQPGGAEMAESSISPQVLREDVTLTVSGKKKGSLSIYRMRHAPSPGAGLAQNEGSSGTGFGAAQRGTLVYYDLRSTGGFACAGNASAVTDSDYRFVVH